MEGLDPAPEGGGAAVAKVAGEEGEPVGKELRRDLQIRRFVVLDEGVVHGSLSLCDSSEVETLGVMKASEERKAWERSSRG